MRIVKSGLDGVLLVEQERSGDDRGFIARTYDVDLMPPIMQMSTSFTARAGTLRGLHYQIRQPQGKLVRVVAGEVFDVVVDLRASSPTFARSVSVRLSADDNRMLWVPPGFAHGFLVLSEFADFLYKTTDYWSPEHERTLLWSDPRLAIDWPIDGAPTLAAKDAAGTPLANAEVYR